MLRMFAIWEKPHFLYYDVTEEYLGYKAAGWDSAKIVQEIKHLCGCHNVIGARLEDIQALSDRRNKFFQ